MITANKKQLKKEQLLNEGVHLMMLYGYHGTGLKLILDTVKIPKGSFYTYFKSKEDFSAEVIKHYTEPFIQRLDHYLDNPERNGLMALQQYYQSLILDLRESDFKGGCLLGDMMSEMSGVSDICRHSLLTSVERYCSLQERALLDGQKKGVVRVDMTAKEMVDLLFNSWQGALLRMKINKSVEPLQKCCKSLLEDYFLVKT
jgi:TetR/AcrR family transcriptional repressor of nem operon